MEDKRMLEILPSETPDEEATPKSSAACCCGSGPAVDRNCCESPGPARRDSAPWIIGSLETPAGEVPRVGTRLRLADRLGAWKARWAIGRMRYGVQPGLYAVGNPSADSPVLASANYKMSFDRLRSRLSGIDAWILVLDTRGINVWCAAGKGTFGTDEIVARVEAVQLARVVSHRGLIVPQLGAPGVAAHEVKKRSGFRVVYGPVRAEDLAAFMAAGMKATAEMRRVKFPLGDRLAVVPVELVMGAKWMLAVAICLLVVSGLGRDGYSLARVAELGSASALLFLALGVWSAVLTPALLPWLPGRALSLKGLWLGLAFLLGVFGCRYLAPGMFGSSLGLAGWCLVAPAVASFVAMNFTGASTYTSLSGVRREMRAAVPIQAVFVLLGTGLWLAGRFV